MTAWKRRCSWLMDKSLNYLALARKAGKAELGEEPVGAAARAGKAYLVIVASDASDHSWRRAKSYVSGTEQQCIRLKQTKDQLGQTIGRASLAMATLTDVSLALAFVKAMETPDPQVLACLTEKSSRQEKRRKEAQAHRKNVRTGKKK